MRRPGAPVIASGSDRHRDILVDLALLLFGASLRRQLSPLTRSRCVTVPLWGLWTTSNDLHVKIVNTDSL